MADLKLLKTAMGELDNDTVIRIVKEVMAEGGGDAQLAIAACQEGMNTVGELFQGGEYFVSDLIFAGDLMTRAMDIIRPAIAKGAGGSVGRMILCTVKDDLHDIGKNIVKAMLEAGGLEVLDLGIDVASATIVETAKQQGINIIALSGVLTLAIDSMKKTVEAFKDAGMRQNVKIIIGGAPVNADVFLEVGADDWGTDATKAVKVCRAWAESAQSK